ncbi:dynein axonemal assembly factor 19 [Amia ocellicauda]|uniref:dynein axonemal assembly factor 19 n=1 Tax=Amia ocellicauda TaxID=2972642 RepID=UPI003464C5A8|nr:CC103 protein [Amia calva]
MGEAEAIDFTALEKELHAAIAADRKYQRENEAKFRAIHQKVGSYEEFRDIVLASHLKPLHREDKASAPRKQPWNTIASSTAQTDRSHSESIEESEFQPRTAAEFNRDWRRGTQSSAGKYHLLLSLGGEGLRRIFSTEIGFGLLGEFLSVLCENFQAGDQVAVTAILKGCSQTQRFGLSMAFLSQLEEQVCRELFQKLQTLPVPLVGSNTGGCVGAGASDSATDAEEVQLSSGLEEETEEEKDVMTELRDLMKLYKVQADS